LRTVERQADSIRVLLAQSSSPDRLSIVSALRRNPGIKVIGASSSHELFEIFSRDLPDLAILDAHLDNDPVGGLATLRRLHDTYPLIPTVLLLDSPKRDLVLDAFCAGARGIFSKHESLEMLSKCVRVVIEGQVWATSREIRYALDALSSAPAIRAMNAGGLNLLSIREQQVVHYLAEGLTNREIGARLGLSRHTIKNYLLKIFDKLGVSNRVELLFLTLSQPAASTRALGEIQSTKKV
jgi:DNA-binding NarL/FixJ family response regulator